MDGWSTTVVDRWFETKGVLLLESTLDGRALRLNREWERMLGWSVDELLELETLDEIAHEDDRGHWVGDRATARLTTKDGQTRPIEWMGVTHREAGRCFGIGIDPGALGEDASRPATYDAALVAAAIDAMVLIDERGIIRHANQATETMFGYAPSELMGRSVGVLMPQPDADMHDRYLDRHLRSGRRSRLLGTSRELEGRHEDGSTFPIDIAISETQVGSERLFAGVIRDLRARTRGNLARRAADLERSARYNQTEARVMGVLGAASSIRSGFTHGLRILGEALGFEPAAVYVRDEASRALRLDTSRAMPAGAPERLALGEGLIGEVARSQSQRVLRKAIPFRLETGIGGLELTSLILTPMIYADQLLGVLALGTHRPPHAADAPLAERMARLMAAMVHSDAQLREVQALSQRLDQRGRQIRAQNEELARANRLKSEFLATMSHELRTPLNAIIGFSEILCDQVFGPLDDKTLDYAGEIHRAGKHLLALINDILDLSKIEAGRMQVLRGTVDVASLLERSTAIIRERAVADEVEVAVEVAPEVGEAVTDERKLRQIVYNLLSNAVKFTDGGGRVTLRGWVEADHLVIEVEDTGVGISEDNLDRVFEAFEQVDGSAAREQEGTGLGLAMVRRLAQLLGGDVEVRSEVGVGSRFTVRLPLETRRPGRVEHPSAPPGSVAPLVLLVEDDDAAAVTLTRHLEDAGYDVVRTRSAEEGERLLEEEGPDVIVLDILLPGRDGWAFLERLQEDEASPAVPVVVVSIAADSERGFALGAAEVLQKPVSGDRVVECIERLGLSPGRSGALRVLVVDDDPATVEQVSAHLEARRHEVIRAYGGAEAIERARQDEPDVIVLDLMMPDVSGFEVVRTLQDTDGSRDLPIVVLTAKTVTSEDWDRLRGGVTQIVEKRAFGEGVLLREVRRAARRGPADAPLPRVGLPRAGAQILVVSRDEGAASQVRRELIQAGYRARVVGDPLAARRRIRQGQSNLVMLDVGTLEDGELSLIADAAAHADRPTPVIVLGTGEEPGERWSFSVDAWLHRPIVQNELHHALRKVLGEPEAPGEARLLVVDDDPRELEMLRAYLVPTSWIIETAASGAEALDAIDARPPDVVVLDLLMPEMSGFEVLERLRDHPATAELPVLVLTAATLTAEERAQIQAQAQWLGTKGTTTPMVLREQVARALRRPEER